MAAIALAVPRHSALRQFAFADHVLGGAAQQAGVFDWRFALGEVDDLLVVPLGRQAKIQGAKGAVGAVGAEPTGADAQLFFPGAKTEFFATPDTTTNKNIKNRNLQGVLDKKTIG